MPSPSAADLISQLSALPQDTLTTDAQTRFQALQLSKRLTATLEGPTNVATEIVFRAMTSVAVRVAVGMGLFEAIVAHSQSPDSTALSSAALATSVGAEELLVSRILRVLASIGFVDEVSQDTWRANEVTHAIASPEISAGQRFVFDVLIRSVVALPAFLKEKRWKSPEEPRDGVFQFANKTDKNTFEWLLATNAENGLFRDFNLFMGATMGERGYWVDWWDVQGRLIDGFEEGVLLVDVAGGKGHDLQAFYEKFGGKEKGVEGRLVLQEVRGVLDGIKEEELNASVERMEVDFFGEQPIKGARAYFMHHILHDWSDKYCLKILKQLREAMKPGYSKLLVHDLILPDTGALEYQTRFDMTMMTFNSGMERSRSQWTKLMEDAGFKVLGLWEHFDADGIVEVEVPL